MPFCRRLSRRPSALLAFVCLLAPHPARAADDAWVEVRSPHFLVYSNAGEKRARNMAWQFEQVQAVLQRLWPWAKGSFERPLLVFAVKDERSMRTLAPEYWERRGGVQPASVFVTAADAHYISVRADVRLDGVEINPYRSSYWSYVALTLTSSIPHELPLWYYRGVAEVFSNTIVRNKDVRVGPVLPWHLDRLRERLPLKLDELLGATRTSQYMTDADRMTQFDASAWALLHYLTFGNGGKNLAAFNEFSIAVGGGAEATAALAKAYGGLPAVGEGYWRYVSKMLYVYKQVDLDIDVDQAVFAARALSAADADVALARYYAATSRPVEARARLAAALQASPQNGAAHEVEGMLLEREDKKAEALAAYARAVETGGTSYYGEFRYAQLSWPQAPDTKEPFPKMEKSLRRAIELRPAFAPAYALLANVLLELDRAPESLPVAQRAVALDAVEAYHQLTLARALVSTGKTAEAMAAAQRARALAKSAFDVNAVERFMTFLQSKSR